MTVGDDYSKFNKLISFFIVKIAELVTIILCHVYRKELLPRVNSTQMSQVIFNLGMLGLAYDLSEYHDNLKCFP